MKQLIKKVFNSLGYSLVKNIKPVTEGTATVHVGKFDIQIFNRSGLKECYRYYKEYGAQLTRLTMVLSKHFPKMAAVDIGANQGDSVSLIKSGADVPVISVEGDGTLAEIYGSNIAQFKNVQLLKTFLSDSPGEMDCTFSKVGHNLTIVPSEKNKDSIYATFSSIDQLYQNEVLTDNCKLLKIDTEGFDLKIMRGGDKFITTVKPAILFEFNRENLEAVETDPFAIFAWLLSRGYNTILFYESDGRFMFSSVLSDKFITTVKPAILFEFNRENLEAVETDPFAIFAWLLSRGYNTILFYESDGRFMFSSVLSDQKLMRQMFDYVDAKNARIYYLDIIVFHTDDNEVADELVLVEEQHRLLAN